jgi:hypothetical protein
LARPQRQPSSAARLHHFVNRPAQKGRGPVDALTCFNFDPQILIVVRNHGLPEFTSWSGEQINFMPSTVVVNAAISRASGMELRASAEI